MGIFGEKQKCCICNIEDGKVKMLDGAVCRECSVLGGKFLPPKPLAKITNIELKNAIERNEKNKNLLAEFEVTQKIGTYIEFDEHKKLWLVPDGFLGKKKDPTVYKYSDILEYELIEDGESLTRGGLGRAVAGGFLFGGVGAVVGGVTGGKKTKSIINKMQIKITIKDINNPVVYINLIVVSTKSSSMIYKSAQNSAQNILSTLSVILDNMKEQDKVSNNNASVSVADELVKMKKLFDDGILSKEEFEKAKEKILNK